MAEALRLFGMKAVVTGAASGIGEAIVRTFVKHGATVFAVDSEPSGSVSSSPTAPENRAPSSAASVASSRQAALWSS